MMAEGWTDVKQYSGMAGEGKANLNLNNEEIRKDHNEMSAIYTRKYEHKSKSR